MPEKLIERPAYHTYVPRRFVSKKAWEAYARWLRRQVKISLCVLPAPVPAPLRAEVFGKWKGNGYTCEKVVFESFPGFYVTGNLFRPTGPARKKKMPGILSPHGHWSDGRLHDHDPKGSVPLRAVNLARLGAVVFSYDMVGMNDSCQISHYGAPEDDLWGLSLMSLQTLNTIRALDFLLSLEEVDASRLGATGASGGATQTFALMATDGRLRAAAPICMISYHMQGGCQCENAPLLRLAATNVDIARLFAPKPMFLGSCTGDWTVNTPKVEYPAIRDIYGLFGKRDRVGHRQVKDDHNYNRELRESVYGFFNQIFFGAKLGDPVSERAVALPPLRDRMVWWGRKAPVALSAGDLKKRWRDRVEKALANGLESRAAAREILSPLLPHVLGMTPGAGKRPRTGGIKLSIDGDRVVVTPGKDMGDAWKRIEFYSTYNPMPFARRVREIVDAIAAIEGQGGRVDLVGKGGAGLWCLFAAAVSGKVKSLEVDVPAEFDPESDASWRRHVNLPAIRQIGGLAPVFAALKDVRVKLHGANAKVRRIAGKYKVQSTKYKVKS